jgi:hypothetical protein
VSFFIEREATTTCGRKAVYYGRLQDYGTLNPILTEVFYVVVNRGGGDSVLVKRGKEIHEQIVCISTLPRSFSWSPSVLIPRWLSSSPTQNRRRTKTGVRSR